MEPQTRPKRSWWSRWLWLIILLAGCGGLYLWYHLQQRAELAGLVAAEADWDKEGIWRWDDWIASRPQLPDEENAAPLIDKMYALLPRGLDNDKNFYLFEEAYRYPNCLYHPEQLQEQRDRVLKLKAVLALWPQFMKTKQAVWSMPYSSAGSPLTMFFPAIQNVRGIANVFGYTLEVKLHDNDISGAVELIRSSNKLVTCMDHQETMIGRLVAIAMTAVNCSQVQRLLGMSEPDPALLAELQSEFERFDNYTGWRNSLRIEAGVGNQTFSDVRSGKLGKNVFELMGGKVSSAWWEKFLDFFRTRFAASPYHQTEYLQFMMKYYRVSDQPWSVQRKLWDEMEHELKSVQMHSSWNLALLFFPALRKVGLAEIKIIAAIRATQVALAAERFRRNTDRWPKSQDELVPTYLKAPLLDPYDDQPIRLRQLDDGLVVYSIGPDDTDDGGNVLETSESRAKDVGIRLWNPNKRRQPAPPLPPEYLEKKKELEAANQEWEKGNQKDEVKKDQ